MDRIEVRVRVRFGLGLIRIKHTSWFKPWSLWLGLGMGFGLGYDLSWST